jgi:hypothetical protein
VAAAVGEVSHLLAEVGARICGRARPTSGDIHQAASPIAQRTVTETTVVKSQRTTPMYHVVDTDERLQITSWTFTRRG